MDSFGSCDNDEEVIVTKIDSEETGTKVEELEEMSSEEDPEETNSLQ